MLKVVNLNSYYDKSHILQGVSFQVGEKEIISLLGRNGVGRSTTLKAIMGSVKSEGSIIFKGTQTIGLKPYEIARLGLGYVPEDRAVFPTLTVRQNLLLAIRNPKQKGRWSIESMFDLFPLLRERADVPAGVLSGGEQQILTICRTLMGDPDLIMIDEPTEGLAPKLVDEVARLLEEISNRGISILLVEQKLTIALKISQRLFVMGHGKIVFEGTSEDLRANEAIRKEWLEV